MCFDHSIAYLRALSSTTDRDLRSFVDYRQQTQGLLVQILTEVIICRSRFGRQLPGGPVIRGLVQPPKPVVQGLIQPAKPVIRGLIQPSKLVSRMLPPRLVALEIGADAQGNACGVY